MVIGLGRFGGALAIELVELGREVLGVDSVEAYRKGETSAFPSRRQK